MNETAARRRFRPIPLVLALLAFLLAVAWLAGAFDSWSRGKRAQADPALYAGPITVCDQPNPTIPADFDYPQGPGVIEGWVAQGPQGEPRAREHGWFLWAGLNSLDDKGQPIWLGWCTATQAFAAAEQAVGKALGGGGSGPGPRSFAAARRANTGTPQAGELPIRFPTSPVYTLPAEVLNNAAYRQAQCIQPQPAEPGQPPPPAQLANGTVFQSNGDIMVAGVIYNDDAFNSLRGQKLYDPATLGAMIPPVGRQQAHPPQLPRTSILLKPMLWPVPANGYSMLPVWDDRADSGSYTGFEIQGQWPRAVAVAAQPQPGVASVTQHMLYGVTLNGAQLGPNNYTGTVHGIDEFYALQPDFASLDPCDRAILDASAWWAYGKGFQPGDYLIVIAMHIMTKEQGDWTFQSVWWSDRAGAGPYSLNRPDIPPSVAPGPWRNYLMASTYGFLGPIGPDRRPQWPIAFNPYIELAADHPVRTNCMNCHHRAAVPGAPNPFKPPPWPSSSYEAGVTAAAPDAPDALDAYRLDSPIFAGLARVDSIWSISDRVALNPNFARARAAPVKAAPPPAKSGPAKPPR